MVFNQSLLQGIFPEKFKVSKVTPIDKGGEEMDPFNYRPISTLSALTQIFKKIICEQLVNYLEKHKILYEFQFGFRKGHSTSQAIAEIADNLRNAIDNNLYSCGVFLDFSKAFDTVNHTILLKKNGTLRDTRRASPTFCKLSHKQTAICTDGKYSFVKANNDVRYSTREFTRPSIIFNLHKRFTKVFKCPNIQNICRRYKRFCLSPQPERS